MGINEFKSKPLMTKIDIDDAQLKLYQRAKHVFEGEIETRWNFPLADFIKYFAIRGYNLYFNL